MNPRFIIRQIFWAQIVAIALEFGYGFGLFAPWQLWAVRPASVLLIPIQLIGFGAGVVYYYGFWAALAAFVAGSLVAVLKVNWPARSFLALRAVLIAWLLGAIFGGIMNATGHSPKL